MFAMTKQLGWMLGFAALGGLMGTTGCGRAIAAGETEAAPREVQLTIYKEDFALVRESRPVDLAAGRNRVRLDSVSRSLDPNTVIFDWAGAKGEPNVVSCTYDLGVGSGAGLLDRLEGKPVDFYWASQDGRPGEKLSGQLEAVEGNGFVIRTGDRLFVNPNGTIVASGEQSLATSPQLSAEIESPSSHRGDLTFAYQTRDLSWSADYVGRLTPDGDALELTGWATLTNNTGIDFPAARITLVAGAPNRVARAPQLQARAKAKYDTLGEDAEVPAAAPMENYRAVGELYAYHVPALASVGQARMTRVKMLSAARTPIKKDYSLTLSAVGAYGWDDGSPRRQNAQLAISFVDDERSGLGLPLPAGAVRIYDDGPGDAPVFVGAAPLADTPKDRHVNLTLSKVFDVVADSRTVSRKQIDKRTVRVSFEAVLRNEKKSAVDVRVVQSFYGKRKLVRESDASTALGASVRQWILRVDPGQSKTLTWTADFSN